MRIKNLKFKISAKGGSASGGKNSGFSLFEMLIAVSVFAAAATIGVGTLLAISEAQQKIFTSRVTQDNLSYVFDAMGKEIRTGNSYHCGAAIDDFSDTPSDCAGGGPSFTFRNSVGQKITYRVNAGRIERVFEGGTPSVSISVLTIAEVNITNLKFYVRGAPAGDNYQPRVLIVLQGIAGAKERIRSSFNIQTLISQRVLDS